MNQEIKEQAIKKLSQKNWSVTCERLLSFCKYEGCNIEDVSIVETSDFKYHLRNTRKPIKGHDVIGCRQYGENSNTYVHAIIY